MNGLGLHVDAIARANLSDPLALEDWCREAAALAEVQIIGMQVHVFPDLWGAGPGVSVNCLIATSHLTVHTWPETGYIMMDLVSCEPFDPEPVWRSFYEDFKVLTAEVSVRERKPPISSSAALKIEGLSPS